MDTLSFQYDAFDRRTRNHMGTRFLHDGVNPIMELNGNAPVASMLSGGVDEVFQRADATGAWAYLADALGSALALADAAGALQTQYTYEPFGNTSSTGVTGINPFQFTGRENDGTGLYYYRARYYYPALHRFVGEDPAGDGDNFYTYAGDDPQISSIHSASRLQHPDFGRV